MLMMSIEQDLLNSSRFSDFAHADSAAQASVAYSCLAQPIWAHVCAKASASKQLRQFCVCRSSCSWPTQPYWS